MLINGTKKTPRMEEFQIWYKIKLFHLGTD